MLCSLLAGVLLVRAPLGVRASCGALAWCLLLPFGVVAHGNLVTTVACFCVALLGLFGLAGRCSPFGWLGFCSNLGGSFGFPGGAALLAVSRGLCWLRACALAGALSGSALVFGVRAGSSLVSVGVVALGKIRHCGGAFFRDLADRVWFRGVLASVRCACDSPPPTNLRYCKCHV